MNRGWCDLYSQHLRGKKYYQAGYHPHLPAQPACLHCSHRSSRVNTRDNIVHTKHWLFFNEIPVALFHRSPPVRGPFIGSFNSAEAPLAPDTGHKFLKINISAGVNLAGHLDGKSFEGPAFLHNALPTTMSLQAVAEIQRHKKKRPPLASLARSAKMHSSRQTATLRCHEGQ